MSAYTYIISRAGVFTADGTQVVEGAIDYAAYQYVKATNDSGETVLLTIKIGDDAQAALDAYNASTTRDLAAEAAGYTVGSMLELLAVAVVGVGAWPAALGGIAVGEVYPYSYVSS